MWNLNIDIYLRGTLPSPIGDWELFNMNGNDGSGDYGHFKPEKDELLPLDKLIHETESAYLIHTFRGDKWFPKCFVSKYEDSLGIRSWLYREKVLGVI